MQTQQTQQQAQHNPIISARNLVMSVIAQAIARKFVETPQLFGAVGVTSEHSLRGKFRVPNQDYAAFLLARAERFGIEEVQVPTSMEYIEDGIFAIAEQVAAEVLTTKDTTRDHARRIALEYVCQACFLHPDEVAPFSEYLPKKLQLAQHIEDINAAKDLSTEETFEVMDATDVANALTEATEAWSGIRTLYATCKHLGTLQPRIVTAPIYTGIEPWQTVRDLPVEHRQATVAQIFAIMREEGTQFVPQTMVADAVAQVAGNVALVDGTPTGVSMTSFIQAGGQDALSGAKPNGGKKLELTDSPAARLGELIAGLRGAATGWIRRTDNGELEINAQIRDGNSDLYSGVPIEVLQQQNAAPRYSA
ncbi:MAG: hypothetical protein Q7S96_05100 [bacterium]|nr:hypothetical protein [bacterium]